MLDWFKRKGGAQPQIPDVPKTFEDAAPNILLSFKPMWQMVQATRSMQNLEGPKEKPSLIYSPFTDDIATIPVLDLPTQKILIHTQFLQGWGKDEQTLFNLGYDNLIKRTAEIQFECLRNEDTGVGILYKSMWRDAYDPARLLFLAEAIHSYPVDGEHVIAIPHENALLFTGSNDFVGLGLIAQELQSAQENPDSKPLPPIVLRHANGRWVPFQTAKDHPVHRQLKLLELQYFGSIYAQQQQMLNDDYVQMDRDNFAATFSAVGSPTGDVGSYCTFTEGVNTMLPKTDHIMFVRIEGEKGTMVASGNWDRVLQILGDSVQKTDAYPSRFYVGKFPDQNQLSAIGNEELFG